MWKTFDSTGQSCCRGVGQDAGGGQRECRKKPWAGDSGSAGRPRQAVLAGRAQAGGMNPSLRQHS